MRHEYTLLQETEGSAVPHNIPRGSCPTVKLSRRKHFNFSHIEIAILPHQAVCNLPREAKSRLESGEKKRIRHFTASFPQSTMFSLLLSGRLGELLAPRPDFDNEVTSLLKVQSNTDWSKLLCNFLI